MVKKLIQNNNLVWTKALPGSTKQLQRATHREMAVAKLTLLLFCSLTNRHTKRTSNKLF